MKSRRCFRIARAISRPPPRARARSSRASRRSRLRPALAERVRAAPRGSPARSARLGRARSPSAWASDRGGLLLELRRRARRQQVVTSWTSRSARRRCPTRVGTGVCAGGVPSARGARSGGSCVSQATSGLELRPLRESVEVAVHARHAAQQREGESGRPRRRLRRGAAGDHDRVGAAARLDPDVLAVGVAGAALAGDPDQAGGGLLGDVAADAGWRVAGGRIDGVVRPRDDDLVEAARDARGLARGSGLRLGRQLGQVGDRRAAGRRPGRAARARRPAARTCSMSGVAARSAGGVRRARPGSASRAKARSGGKAALRLAKAGSAASSTSGSFAIACSSAASSAANEPETMRKFVTRSCSASSLRAERRDDLVEVADQAREVVRLRCPGSASLTCDVYLKAPGGGAVELLEALGAAVLR